MRVTVVVAVLAALIAAAGFASIYAGAPQDISGLKSIGAPTKVVAAGNYEGYKITDGYVLVKLAGSDGWSVTASISLREIYSIAGAGFAFDKRVVVAGLYIPWNRTIIVTRVLQGCHAAYTQPVAG